MASRLPLRTALARRAPRDSGHRTNGSAARKGGRLIAASHRGHSYMPVDPDSLRQHYASLSDEALLEINREDLVETAQRCYDDEVAERQLALEVDVPGSSPADEQAEFYHEAPGSSDQPDWLEEAAEVYSRYDLTGTGPTSDVVDARDALEAAGIPCHMDLVPEEKSDTRTPTHRWRLTVPGNLNLHATSVLDRDIFNAEFEAEW